MGNSPMSEPRELWVREIKARGAKFGCSTKPYDKPYITRTFRTWKVFHEDVVLELTERLNEAERALEHQSKTLRYLMERYKKLSDKFKTLCPVVVAANSASSDKVKAK